MQCYCVPKDSRDDTPPVNELIAILALRVSFLSHSWRGFKSIHGSEADLLYVAGCRFLMIRATPGGDGVN